MRALKFLVVGMAVLIAAAVVTIVVTLYNRATAPPAGKAWRAELMLPAGGAIRDFRIDGDRLVVRAGGPGKPDMLYVIHLSSGAVLGTVAIKNGQ